MPSTSARPSERKSSFATSETPYLRPGSRIAGLPAVATALSSSVEKLKPLSASTHTVITAAPAMSRPALMICTHVVPFMPPMST